MSRCSFLLVLITLFLTGCASVAPYAGGQLKAQKALIIIDFDKQNTLFISADGMTNPLYKTADGPMLVEVNAGQLHLHTISDSQMSFNPELSAVTIAPGSINYLGKLETIFDYPKQRAYSKVWDEEQSAIATIESAYAGITKKYPYKKSILHRRFSSYGSINDYNSMNIPKPGNNDALVVVYRPNDGSPGFLVTAGIYVDGVRLVGLETNNYSYFRLPAGEYKFTAGIGLLQDIQAENTVEVKAGTAYFYKLAGANIFKRIPIPEAVAEMRNYEYDKIENSPKPSAAH